MREETLAALKDDFDSVVLLDKDAAEGMSLELATGMDDDDHLLLWKKRHPVHGLGYAIMPIPNPELFDEDPVFVEWAIRAAKEAYDWELRRYEAQP